VDENSMVIKELNGQGKTALVGIHHRKGGYTIVGKQFVYYQTSSGKRGEIALNDFVEELHENGFRIGAGYLKTKFLYKNLVLGNEDKVWLNNANTMFSLCNLVLWIKELPSEASFD
jgi:hypothetical protein